MRACTRILVAILLVSALLRLWGLTRGDPVSDEVLMGFRSIGLIDFDLAEFQTTPWEWFDHHTLRQCARTQEGSFSGEIIAPDQLNIPSTMLERVCNAAIGVEADSQIPWWVRLSWHDHPPLVFYIQHLSFAVFGENLFALRFPSALLGIVSVLLLYLIGKKLYLGVELPSDAGALFGALFGAVTLNAVYISRTGMQESYAIFFILLSCYFFLRALENPRYFLCTGVAMGAGFLAKYTVLFFTAPLFLLYLLVFYHGAFRQKNLWFGAGIILLFATPVIMYNIMLYRAVGHFDFQFSTLFSQDHPAWQVQPGKEIGSVADRASRFLPNLIATNSWLFLALAAAAIIGFCISFLRNARATIHRHSFLIFAIGVMFLLFLGIGPSYRFLTMLTPFLALAVGIMVSHNNALAFPARPSEASSWFRSMFIPLTWGAIPASISKPARSLLWLAFSFIILFEIFYSWNSQVAYYPEGPTPWLASKVKYENYNWGYNELARYFEDEFRGKVPAVTFDLQYQFLEQLRDKALARGVDEGNALYPALVVTYGNFDKGGKLWALDRLHIYHAWPIIDLATYYDYLRERGNDFYARSGFKYFYFVFSANTVAAPEFRAAVKGIEPVSIKNPRGDTMFLVYRK